VTVAVVSEGIEIVYSYFYIIVTCPNTPLFEDSAYVNVPSRRHARIK
jgi:hypothetical protein